MKSDFEYIIEASKNAAVSIDTLSSTDLISIVRRAQMLKASDEHQEKVNSKAKTNKLPKKLEETLPKTLNVVILPADVKSGTMLFRDTKKSTWKALNMPMVENIEPYFVYFVINEPITEPTWCINNNRDTLYLVEPITGEEHKYWDKVIASNNPKLAHYLTIGNEYLYYYSKMNGTDTKVYVYYTNDGTPEVNKKGDIIWHTDLEPHLTDHEYPKNDFNWTYNLNAPAIAHLMWIYERLIEVHKENENYDYMIRFKAIIDKIAKDKYK